MKVVPYIMIGTFKKIVLDLRVARELNASVR